MHINEIQQWVAQEMLYLKSIGAYRVHLCIFKKHLCITQLTHTLIAHPILFVFTRQQVIDGLTSDEWDRILRIVLNNEGRYPIWTSPESQAHHQSLNQSDV